MQIRWWPASQTCIGRCIMFHKRRRFSAAKADCGRKFLLICDCTLSPFPFPSSKTCHRYLFHEPPISFRDSVDCVLCLQSFPQRPLKSLPLFCGRHGPHRDPYLYFAARSPFDDFGSFFGRDMIFIIAEDGSEAVSCSLGTGLVLAAHDLIAMCRSRLASDNAVLFEPRNVTDLFIERGFAFGTGRGLVELTCLMALAGRCLLKCAQDCVSFQFIVGA